MQFVQRALGAKHSDEGQKGAFKLIGVYYIVVPGVTAFSFVWLRNRNADSVYPRLIIDLLPASLTGVFCRYFIQGDFKLFQWGFRQYSYPVYIKYIQANVQAR